MATSIKTELKANQHLASDAGYRVVRVVGVNVKSIMTLKKWCLDTAQDSYAMTKAMQDYGRDGRYTFCYFAFKNETDMLMFLLLLPSGYDKDCIWSSNTKFDMFNKIEKEVPCIAVKLEGQRIR